MLKKLFLIDGAAGTGKTDFIQYVKEKYHNANILSKYTTRPLREDDNRENLDLISLSEEEFKKKILKNKIHIYMEDVHMDFWKKT